MSGHECDELRYQPSRDQRELASSLSGALEELLPLSRLHAAPHESVDVWRALGDLGVLGVAVDEAAGGSGLGAAEEALIVGELGRRLVSPAVLATIGAGHAAWPGSEVSSADRRVASGYVDQGRLVVIGDPTCDLVLVRTDPPVVRTMPAATQPLDDRHWGVALVEGRLEPGVVVGFSERASLRLKLLDAAALSGLAQAALEMAVEYAGLREQFGRPIGSFQAVKHRCADMALASWSARDLVSFAAVAFDDGRAEAASLIEAALFVAGSSAVANAGANIQIHGGIGFSDEAAPHLVLKRAQLLLAAAGGLDAAAERIADRPIEEDCG